MVLSRRTHLHVIWTNVNRYFQYPAEELYYLAADPFERVQLSVRSESVRPIGHDAEGTRRADAGTRRSTDRLRKTITTR